MLKNSLKYDVILLCYGKSVRYNKDSGSRKNKLLLDLDNNLKVVDISLQFFLSSKFINNIIVVATSEIKLYLKKRYPKESKLIFTGGGSTRSQSTSLGIKKVITPFFIVHDGSRPFFNTFLINEFHKFKDKYSAVIPGSPVTNTIKTVDKNIVSETLDRNRIYEIYTPQFFNTKCYINAIENINLQKKIFYDDSQILENTMNDIFIIDDYSFNLKITIPKDFFILKYYFLNMKESLSWIQW